MFEQVPQLTGNSSRAAWFTKQAIQTLELGSVLYGRDSLKNYDKIHSMLSQILDAQTVHEVSNHPDYKRLEVTSDRSSVGSAEWFIKSGTEGTLFSIIPRMDLGFDMESLTGIGNLQRRLKYLLLAQAYDAQATSADKSPVDEPTETEGSEKLSIWGDHNMTMRKNLTEIIGWNVTELHEHELRASRFTK